MQRRAEPAGAAEPPPRRTLGRPGSACGDPPARPGAARYRRCPARYCPVRCGGARPGAGCEPRGGGEERVRACVCHAWVRVSVGDAVRGFPVPRERVGAACAWDARGGGVCPRWAVVMPRQVEAQVPTGIGVAGMQPGCSRDAGVLPRGCVGPHNGCPRPRPPWAVGAPCLLRGSCGLVLLTGLWDTLLPVGLWLSGP